MCRQPRKGLAKRFVVNEAEEITQTQEQDDDDHIRKQIHSDRASEGFLPRERQSECSYVFLLQPSPCDC